MYLQSGTGWFLREPGRYEVPNSEGPGMGCGKERALPRWCEPEARAGDSLTGVVQRPWAPTQWSDHYPPIHQTRPSQFWCETQGSGFGGIRAAEEGAGGCVGLPQDPERKRLVGGKELRPKLAEPRELRITVYVLWKVRYGK
jgi:hypothetical protein